ncbi:hypothetical protein, partial [Escherichia coli]|uniref:hypothetical protein n=1 Tax=Escherichia coli TaxID=562 RepID=UPI00200FF048
SPWRFFGAVSFIVGLFYCFNSPPFSILAIRPTNTSAGIGGIQASAVEIKLTLKIAKQIVFITNPFFRRKPYNTTNI